MNCKIKNITTKFIYLINDHSSTTRRETELI